MKVLSRVGCAAIFAFMSYATEFNFDIDSLENEALTAGVMKAAAEAAAMNRKGLEALDQNDDATAMACFDKAIKLFPDYSDAINNRGVVKFRKGDIGGASAIWKKLASRDPDYAIVSYNLSLVYLHERDRDAAVRLLQRALKANKRFIEARVRLGALLLEKGEKRKSLDELRTAYTMAPTHPDAWSFYAYALVENGDTLKAVQILDKYQDKPEALKLLGRIESSRKNYEAAKKLLSDAVSRGADPELLLELADAQVESKKCKEALQTLSAYFAKNIAHAADAYLLAGIASKECGDIDASARYFEKGCATHPHDGILRYNLGQMYFLQKKFDKAEQAWKSLSDTLQDPSLLHLRALNALRSKDLGTAESLIKKALEMDERAEYHDFLGVVYYRRGDAKKAEAEFRKAVKMDPGLRSAQLNLALSTKSAGEIDQAVRSLEMQRSSCSGDACADIAFQLAMLYYYRKDLDQAVATLSSIRERDRTERVYRNLAIFYREQHKYGKAIAALETAVKKLVVEPQTEYELAETYLVAGSYTKAIERFKALIGKWRKNTWRLYYQLGYAHMEQNDLDKAKECFQKSLNLKKDNVASRGLLAYVYNREGNVEKARELWKKNLDDDPSNAALWVNMGLSFQQDGKYDQALEYYTKAASLKGNDPQIQINIGNVYTSMEKYTDALNAYKHALGSSKREIAQYNMFLVHAKKRDKDRASQALAVLQKESGGSDNTVRAAAEMALWNSDTAKALSMIEGLSQKEAGDWATLAQVYAATGKGEKARACLAKIPKQAQWEKERADVRVALAFNSGNYSEVIAIMRKRRDTSLAGQYNLALAYFHLKKYEEALAACERLIKKATGTDRADLCRLAGNSAFGLRQWKNALQWYLQLSNVEARSPVVQYNLAVASYNLGKVDQAYAYYRKARELDPKIQNADIEKRYAAKHDTLGPRSRIDPLDSLYNAAVGLQSAGNDSAAESIYKKVVAKNPHYNLAWNNLGAIYGKRGEIEKCEHAYQKAVEKKHDIPETYANLVNLYIELEEFTKARQWLIKGQGHNPESEVLKDLRQKIVEAEQKKGKGDK
ncbi:MAG: tetratricopeptide repeat protein [Chitinispirillaceae bacterium]|nr:tetratricopeptide repeat protein [Chitinispirillaceae bacterium]